MVESSRSLGAEHVIWRNKKCIQNFVGKTPGKWLLRALEMGWENDIKMDMTAFFNILPNASFTITFQILAT
jgi:hypothetical protein